MAPTIRSSCTNPSVTVHVGFVPLHGPVHPAKVEPAAGVAVSITRACGGYTASQMAPAPHDMPAGLDVTVPTPLPPVRTSSDATPTAKRGPMTSTSYTVDVSETR